MEFQPHVKWAISQGIAIDLDDFLMVSFDHTIKNFLKDKFEFIFIIIFLGVM